MQNKPRRDSPCQTSRVARLLTTVVKPQRLTRKRVQAGVSYLGGKLFKPSAVEGGDRTI
jgi:hypothetical protein